MSAKVALTPTEKLLKENTRKSVYLFAEFFLKHFLITETPSFHKEIYNLLPKSRRLVLAAPRGFSKTTIASIIYPMWLSLWKYASDICIISASETLAVDWLRKIKHEIANNLKVIEYFGQQKSSKWSESHIILKNGVNVRAKGANAQIRGFRPDVIICDDLETDEMVRSEDQRKQLKEWIFKACINTLVPDGQLFIIGTVIHPLSVLADLLAMDNGWVKKKYMAYVHGEQKEGDELWKEVWPHERLQGRKREIGSFAFSSEFMNNPVSDETAPIKENQVRYWHNLPSQHNAVIAVDPAYSEDETADFKVAVLILCDERGNRYLSHYIREHCAIGDFQDRIINLWLNNRNTVTAVGIPNSGVEKGFYDSFLKKCQDRRVYPPVMELKNVFTNTLTNISIRNKTARVVAALQPLFENGKYYIGGDMVEARDELLTIGVSKHDDIVDAMAYAESILVPYYNTGQDNNHDGELGASQVHNYGYEQEVFV